MLEKVQGRATSMISVCRVLKYEEILKVFVLTTFEQIILNADLLEIYKIVHKIDEVNEDVLLPVLYNISR